MKKEKTEKNSISNRIIFIKQSKNNAPQYDHYRIDMVPFSSVCGIDNRASM
jgi:hypothetical protein